MRPLSVRVPPGERRNLAPMVRLAVRPPMAEGGVPAVEAAPEVWAVIEKAAVAAVVGDAAAREHVLGKRPMAPDLAAP